MKLITVTGYKGGCGKSTTAIHLATYFSEGGVPVFDSTIRRTSGFGNAAIAGVPIKDIKDKTKVAGEDYKALGKKVGAIING